MAVLKKYNYGLIYRRLTSKYFNMHEYSLLEGESLWAWKDWDYEKRLEESNDNIPPERDIIFLSDNERKLLEFPDRRVLYCTEDTGGLWIYTTRWVLLNPSYQGLKPITFEAIDRIVGVGGIGDDDKENPKFYSDIIFTTDKQRKNLIKPRTETLYVVKDTGEFYIYDTKWYEVSCDPNTTKVRAINTTAIDNMVDRINQLYPNN